VDFEVRKRLDCVLAIRMDLDFDWRVAIMLVGRFIVTVHVDRLPQTVDGGFEKELRSLASL